LEDRSSLEILPVSCGILVLRRVGSIFHNHQPRSVVKVVYHSVLLDQKVKDSNDPA
jgi:hypothetical protein